MPDFAFNEDQDALRATVRRFCEERSPSSEARRLMETEEGFDPGVWTQLSTELGLTGINVAEADGGQGFGFVELGIVLEEMGRALVPGPFFATVCLAAPVLLESDGGRDVLSGIASGSQPFAIEIPCGSMMMKAAPSAAP